MIENPSKRQKTLKSLLSGAKWGLIAGIGLAMLSLIAAGIIKVLITWPTLEWPDWFPGNIVELFLSGWWIALCIVSCTLAGALIGGLRPRHWELL
jgi:hypothetical protein